MAALVQLFVATTLVVFLSSFSLQAVAVVKRESHQRPMKLTWVPVVEPSDLANAQSLVIGIQPIHEGESRKGSTQDTSYGKVKTGNKLVMDLTPLSENKWSKYGGHNDENKYSKTRPTAANSENYEGERGGDSYDDAVSSGSYQGEGKSVDSGRSQPAGISDELDDGGAPTRTYVDSIRDYEPSAAIGDERGPSLYYDEDRSNRKNEDEHYGDPSEKYEDTRKKFFMPEEFDDERAAAAVHYDDDDEDEDDDKGHYSPSTHGGNKDGKYDDYYGPLEEFEGAYAPNAGQRQASENYENSNKDDEDGSVGGTSDDVQPTRNNDLEPSRNMFKDLGVGFKSDSSDSTDSADKFDFIPKDITVDARKYHIPKAEYPKLDETPYKIKSSSEQNEFVPSGQQVKSSPSYTPKWTDVADTRDGNGPNYQDDKSVTIDTYEDPNPRKQSRPLPTGESYLRPVPVQESTTNKKPIAKFVGDEVYVEPLHPRDHQEYQRPVPSQSSQQSFPKSQHSADPYAFPDEVASHAVSSKDGSGSYKEHNIQSSNSKTQSNPNYEQNQNFEQHRPYNHPHSEGRHDESRKYHDSSLPKPQRQPNYEREQTRSSIPTPLLKPNYEHHPELQQYHPQPKPSVKSQYDSRYHDAPQSSNRQSQRKPEYDDSHSDKQHTFPQQVPKDMQQGFVLGLPLPNDQTSSEYTASPTVQQAPRPPQHYSSKPQRQPTGDRQYQESSRPAPSRDYVDSQRYEKPQHGSSAPRPTHHHGGLGIGIGFLSDIETPHKHSSDASGKQYRRSEH